MNTLSIFILSDSLGETGEQVVRSILAQFKLQHYTLKRFPRILTETLLEQVLEEASDTENCIVFYTIVQEHLIAHLTALSKGKTYTVVDLLGPGMDAVQQVSGRDPEREPGSLRKLDKTYFNRVESIEFSVRYDDGQDPRGILKADLVILGVSRTSKTPLAMYLANKNVKVANVPLFPESEPPKEIFEVSPKKVIGLTNAPDTLNKIRKERLKSLGLPQHSSYAGMNRILEELDYAEAVMKKIGCFVIDVQDKAIEETAEIIFNYMKKTGTKIFNE